MKVKIPIYAGSIALIVVLQTTVLEYISIWNIKPNLPVIFIISVALLRGNPEGAIIGLVTGLVLDFSAGKLIGLNGLFGLYLGLVIGFFNKKLYRENLLIVFIFTLACSLGYEILIHLVSGLTVGKFVWLYAFKNVIFPVTVYNSVLSLLVHLIAGRLNQRVENIDRVQGKKY